MKVLLVDDHAMLTQGIASLLSDGDAAGRFEVRATSDPFEAVDLAASFRPDLAVVDLTMPTMNGFELTRRLTEVDGVKPRVVVLSMHSDPEFVAEALRCGASGYLVKHAAASELRAAIDPVSRGKTFLSPAVAGTLVERYIKNPGDIAPRYTLLSPRERQTLQMLAEGLSVKEIAYKLDLSDKTVHAFRSNLMHKLEINSIAELTKYAVRHGLTSVD